VSPTFHGRDIFAPAAAHLSRGVTLARLGPLIDSMVALPAFRAARDAAGVLRARVLHIDHFGNLVTDAREQDLPAGTFTVHCGAGTARGPVRTYEGASGLVALVGSAGYLELALPSGSAAAFTGARIGSPVSVEPA
jgi:S-adenosylmethionine hydrolase